MKKTLAIATAVLTLAGGSAALAQPYGGYTQGYGQSYERGYGYDRDHRSYDRDHRGYDTNRYDRNDRRGEYRRWSRGDRLPSSYRSSRYAVDYRRHHLRAPPRGYQWRQVDNNYVLAAVASGLILEIISGR